MLQYGGVESFLEHLGACIEIVNLLLGERIKLRFITTGQVREDGLNTNGFVGFQTCNKPRHVLLIETQTMHAAVYLDMNRVVLQTLGFCGGDDSLQRLMRIDIRLEIILQNDVHRGYLRIHDDNR